MKTLDNMEKSGEKIEKSDAGHCPLPTFPHSLLISSRLPRLRQYFSVSVCICLSLLLCIPSTLLCYISLLSGLWNIAHGGNPRVDCKWGRRGQKWPIWIRFFCKMSVSTVHMDSGKAFYIYISLTPPTTRAPLAVLITDLTKRSEMTKQRQNK